MQAGATSAVLHGVEYDLTFGWDQFGGGWCLTVTRRGARRALRRFPLDSLSHAQALATRIADMLAQR